MIKKYSFQSYLLCVFSLLTVSLGCAQPNLPINAERKSEQVINNAPTNYAECVAAGFPALRSYPGKCVANGQTFIDESVKTPDLKSNSASKICVNKCGDGECQEIVCFGSGCPCGETQTDCPADCK